MRILPSIILSSEYEERIHKEHPFSKKNVVERMEKTLNEFFDKKTTFHREDYDDKFYIKENRYIPIPHIQLILRPKEKKFERNSLYIRL